MRKAITKGAKAGKIDARSFKTFQGKVDKAWLKLRNDIEKKASLDVIRRDRDELTYLLGECDYLWHEFKRCYDQYQ